MSRQVEFIWYASKKVWLVNGKDIDDITRKCHEMCAKYHAIHFQIL